MAEEMNRVVLRHTDERGAERQRDAMNRAEHRAHSGQPHNASAGDGQGPEHHDGGASVRKEQQHDEPDGIDRAEQRGFGLRAALHQHGERAGPAHDHARRGRRARLREMLLQCGGRFFLAVRIERGGFRRRNEDGAAPRAVEPHIELLLRLLRGLPGFGELEHFECRVARDQRLEDAAGRRRQILQPLAELIVQKGRIEARLIERGGQQVPIRQQLFRNCIERGLAVRHEAELRVLTQRRGERLRALGQQLRIGAIERNEQQPGSRALAYFFQQQLLHARFRCGQEEPQIAADGELLLNVEAEQCNDDHPAYQESDPPPARHPSTPGCAEVVEPLALNWRGERGFRGFPDEHDARLPIRRRRDDAARLVVVALDQDVVNILAHAR